MSLSCAQQRIHGDARPWDPKLGPSQPTPAPQVIDRCVYIVGVCAGLLLRSRRVGDPLFRSPADFQDQGKNKGRAPYAYSVCSVVPLLISLSVPKKSWQLFGVRLCKQCTIFVRTLLSWASAGQTSPNQSTHQKEETKKRQQQDRVCAASSAKDSQPRIPKRTDGPEPRCCGRSQGGGAQDQRTRSSFALDKWMPPTPTTTAPGQNTQ